MALNPRARLAAILLFGLASACHHAQSIVAVTEERFRLEVKHADAKQPPNPTYNPLHLPLSPDDSAKLSDFLAANAGAEPRATRDLYAPLLTLLRENSWKYEDILDKKVFKTWLPKTQVGGVVDAREEKPPTFAPIAAHGGPFWWVFYVRGHDVTGLIVFKESVAKPQPRSKR